MCALCHERLSCTKGQVYLVTPAAGTDDTLGASASQHHLAAATGLSVEEQVDRLVRQATAVENLCQLFFGWCPWA